MALEPRDVSGEEEENRELIDMSRRFWVSAALSLPVFIMAMAHDLMPGLITGSFFTHSLQWFEFVLPHRSFCGAAGLFFSAVGAPLSLAI
jgi:Cu+-exporting ATPase